MFSGKKLLLLGFIVVLLVAIPITVYLVQQQQKTEIKAAPSTILSVVDVDTGSSSKTMAVGESANFKVVVNPGSNQVSFVKFTLTYDSTKLDVQANGFTPNEGTFPSILQGPTYAAGSVTVTMSIGGSLDKVIQTPKEAGTLTVTAIGSTNGATTKIDFGTPQVLSVGATDTFNENVFSSSVPAVITIDEGATPTVTPEPTPTPAPSPTPGPTATPTVTPGPTGTPSANQLPSCTSLALNSSSTGTAPYALMLTANGNDTDGTVNKVTFNFGDGQVQDVTDGVNTGSVSVQTSHIYSTAGTFTATAAMTDNSGGVSSTELCTQVITINGGGGAVITIAPTNTPIPTMPPTGPGSAIMTFGAVGAILSVIGILLFLAL